MNISTSFELYCFFILLFTVQIFNLLVFCFKHVSVHINNHTHAFAVSATGVSIAFAVPQGSRSSGQSDYKDRKISKHYTFQKPN